MKNVLRAAIIILLVLVAIIFIDMGRILLSENKDSHNSPNNVIEIGTPQDATPQDGAAWSGSATPVDATSTDQVETATFTDVSDTATHSDSRSDSINEVAAETFSEEEPEELPTHVSIEMELVYQNPELPTGCESVALTMLLKYYGFELDKTTIASDYLVYSDNFVDGYMGNPFTTGGAGIYSPGLTRTANIYLNDQDTVLNAKNITGSTPETLYKFLANDTPVVVWNTVYMLPNNPTGLVKKYGEKTYEWDSCEHCMVLTGYDLEKNIVIVHDPIEGIVERDADEFWERYENLGSMAIMIR